MLSIQFVVQVQGSHLYEWIRNQETMVLSGEIYKITNVKGGTVLDLSEGGMSSKSAVLLKLSIYPLDLINSSNWIHGSRPPWPTPTARLPLLGSVSNLMYLSDPVDWMVHSDALSLTIHYRQVKDQCEMDTTFIFIISAFSCPARKAILTSWTMKTWQSGVIRTVRARRGSLIVSDSYRQSLVLIFSFRSQMGMATDYDEIMCSTLGHLIWIFKRIGSISAIDWTNFTYLIGR